MVLKKTIELAELAMGQLEVLVVADVSTVAPINGIISIQWNPLRLVAELQAKVQSATITVLQYVSSHDLSELADFEREIGFKAFYRIREVHLGKER